MNHYVALKVLAIVMTIVCVANARLFNVSRVLALKTNYDEYGLDGYLLSTDTKSGLLIPPKPLTSIELRTLIVDSKWKDKYCKVSVDYTLLNLKTCNGHYCLEKIEEGDDQGKYKNLCCGDNTCECQWSRVGPFNCDCKPPKVVE